MKTQSVKIITITITACIVGAILLINRDQKSVHAQTSPSIWSKQLGTGSDDDALTISVDGQNNVFVAGSTDGNLFSTNTGGTNAFLVRYNPDGTIAWSKQFGTGVSDFITSIARDSNGNIYVGGSTDGSLFQSSAGGEDSFLIKFDALGNQLWTKQFGTTTDDRICALAIDGQNNVIAVGFTNGSLFEPNTGPDNAGNPVSDSFIVKYDSNGNQLWGHQFGADDSDNASSVGIDGQGNIYVTGSTEVGWQKQLFAPVTAGTGGNAYLAKFSSSGSLIWGRQFGDACFSICVDSLGNSYVGGSQNVTSDSPISGSGFISKYDNNGNQLWTQTIGSYGEEINSVTLDNQGNLVAAGSTRASLFGPASGDDDIILMKYSPSGNVLWQEQEGTSARDSVDSITTDNSNNIFLAGITQGNLFATNAGGDDAFIERVNTSGIIASVLKKHSFPFKPLLSAWSGQRIALTYPSVLANNRPYVYAGYLCSGIPGAKVIRTASKQMVIEGRGKQIVISPSSLTYQINGKAHKMTAKPVMVGNECYVPLDVMKAVLPYPVHYDAKALTVHFDPPQKKVARR